VEQRREQEGGKEYKGWNSLLMEGFRKGIANTIRHLKSGISSP
jgi:hypothetical protein